MSRSQSLRDSYDWVVLGDRPAALLSAALCARAGRSVLVVPDFSEKKWWVSSTGQLVDPESALTLGVGSPELGLGFVGVELRDLGFSEWEVFRPLKFGPQVVTPDLRMSWSDFEGALADPVESLAIWREVPRALEDLLSGMAQRRESALLMGTSENSRSGSVFSAKKWSQNLAQAEKLWSTRWSREFFQRVDPRSRGRFQGGPLFSRISGVEADWIRGILGALLGVPPGQTTEIFDAAQVLYSSRTAMGVRGGLSQFRAQLRRLAERWGAEISEAPFGLSRIFFDEGRVLGVQLAGSDRTRNVTHAQGVLSALHPQRILELSGGAEEIAQSHSADQELLRVTLSMTLPREAIPEPLADRAVWSEAGAPLVEFDRVSVDDYALPAKPDQEVLFLRVSFPRVEVMHWSTAKWRTILERLFQQAEEVIPFLGRNVLRVFPDFRSEDFSAHWDEYVRQSRGWMSDELIFSRGMGNSRIEAVEGYFPIHSALSPALGMIGEWRRAIHASRGILNGAEALDSQSQT